MTNKKIGEPGYGVKESEETKPDSPLPNQPERASWLHWLDPAKLKKQAAIPVRTSEFIKEKKKKKDAKN